MKSPLMLIFLTVFIDLVGFGLIVPVLPTYAKELHADGLMVGIVMASYSLMQFFFTPIWGKLSDSVGRRPIILLSLLASVIGYLIWGFSNSLVLLILARCVAGAGNANIAVAQAYVSDVTTLENRAKGMGAIGAAFGLGFVLGPAIGGFLAGFGIAKIGFAAASLSLIDLILTFFLLPEPEKRSNAGKQRFDLKPQFIVDTIKNPSLQGSLLIFFISTLAFANMEATLVLLTSLKFGYTTKANSFMFTYVGLIIVFVQGGMIHRLVKKYGEKVLVISGCAILSLGLLLTGYASNQTFLYIALALLAIGSGINTPANQSMLSKLAPSENTGAVLGIGQSLSTLGRILGPVIGGYAFDHFGVSVPYLIGSSIMVIAFTIALKLPKSINLAQTV